MKRLRLIGLLTALVLLCAACGEGQGSLTTGEPPLSLPSGTSAIQSGDGEISVGEGKVLIAYFSWAENAEQENIDAMTSPSVRAPGNVAQFATWIREETGGELFSIRVKDPYPADWNGCLSRANAEKADGVHPQLSQTLDSIEEYDTVFLGYPNWWYSCPMAIFSFLDEHDLSGKRVYLFSRNGRTGEQCAGHYGGAARRRYFGSGLSRLSAPVPAGKPVR